MVKQGLKASTADTYEQISKQIWKDHFIGRTFREYEPHRGNKVDGLVTRKYGRRTLAHVRSLASGIFTGATYAAKDGLLQNNPWRNVKTKIKPPKPKESESRNAGVEKSSGPIRENPWPVRFCQRPSYFGCGTMRR